MRNVVENGARRDFLTVKYLRGEISCGEFSCSEITGHSIVCISDTMAWHPLQENEAIISTIYYSKNLTEFSKSTFCIKNVYSSYIVNSRIIICISDKNASQLLQIMKRFSKNLYFLSYRWNFLNVMALLLLRYWR